MNKEEIKAIEKLKETQDSYLKDELDYAIETVLNLIQKQDKIIDKFSKALVNCVGTCPADYSGDLTPECEKCNDDYEKCWIEYFKKEVEKDVKD